MNPTSYRYWIIISFGLASVLGLSFGQPPAAPADKPDTNAAQEGDTRADAELRSAVRGSRLRKHVQAGLTEDEKRFIADNCQFGMPKPEQGADLGPFKIIAREGYAAGHSSESKIPLWVCERATKAEVTGNADRDLSSFLPDPKLAGSPRAELKDYKGSGYDRGHMAPAGNQKSSQARMDETFFLSNMSPQYGLTFNRGIWAALEDQVRDWTRERGETWIITGPMFYDPLEETESTADGLVPYFTIGPGDVAVPTHCFKIILAKKGNDWETIAFVMTNARHAKPYHLENHRTTVDWIEERTGLNFFPDLDANPTMIPLINKLEAHKADMWGEN